ncbi:MAG TPA: CCA tRNA nucleotidyltransferase [Devosia sp.]|nr:CCA tRNA nucleotidyltransferase [Devosia sp.]
MTNAIALGRLKRAEWLRQPETQQVLAVLEGAHNRTRVVGGIVRDTLLDRSRERSDIDFATEFTPDEVMRRMSEKGIAVYPTGVEHGTVTVRIGDFSGEVTTLREDVETYGRRAKVRFGHDWHRDAERRDFTLNALYAGMDGSLFDPIGGLEDCLAGRVKFIGDPDTRIAEDRLRVYRFFRFSASHGGERFDPKGLAAVTRAAGTLSALSAERVGGEMRRLLSLPRAVRTIRTMVDAGILTYPTALIGALDTYERQARRPNRNGRFALLVDVLGGGELKARWRLSNEDIAVATQTLEAARLMIGGELAEAAYRFPAVGADALDVAAALAPWTEAAKAEIARELDDLEVPRFPVTGRDLLNLGYRQGPKLGAVLARLEKAWIKSGFRLGRDELLAEAGRQR